MDCVREATVKELIEQSDIDNKDLILSIMKDEDSYTHRRIKNYETTIDEKRHLIESYRVVLQDIIYSNFLNK